MERLTLNFGLEWPTGQYRVIYADPPWHFQTFSDSGRGRCADNHYNVMSRNDLLSLPVDRLAHPEGCVLLLWTTSDQLGFAQETLLPAWGFVYKSRGPDWVKRKGDEAVVRVLSDAVDRHRAGEEVDWSETLENCLVMGMGYYLRQQSEECLLATTSAVPPRLSKGVRQVVIAPRREHSRKPDAVYDRIEQLFPGPYLELFSRTERPGWDCWGNETGKFEEAYHAD